MSEVYAVKRKEDIDAIEEFLLKHYGSLFSDVWKLGINLALRASDLLSITKDEAIRAVNTGHLVVLEKKTGYRTLDRGLSTERKERTKKKPRVIKLNSAALKIMRERTDDYMNVEWLFQSMAKNQRGENKGKNMPITYQAVWVAFREAGNSVGIKMGTHTMRKTRGYAMFKKGIHIVRICSMFNHSSVDMTLKYIGMEQEEIDQDYDDIVL